MARTIASAPPAQRLLPSGRSLAVGFGLLAAAGAVYLGAARTSVFAVRAVTVESVPASQESVVERALRGLSGRSLLQVDAAAIERRLAGLPHVHLISYDRAFPDELRVRVSVERPVAVVRRGSDRWLVSADARVLRPLEQRLRRPLPVVWVRRSVEPEVGAILEDADPARDVAALAEIERAAPALTGRVWYVKFDGGELIAVLRNRFEVRLGSTGDLAVKLAVAARLLQTLEAGEAAYADVSVPERSVVGTAVTETLDSQVEP